MCFFGSQQGFMVRLPVQNFGSLDSTKNDLKTASYLAISIWKQQVEFFMHQSNDVGVIWGFCDMGLWKSFGILAIDQWERRVLVDFLLKILLFTFRQKKANIEPILDGINFISGAILVYTLLWDIMVGIDCVTLNLKFWGEEHELDVPHIIVHLMWGYECDVIIKRQDSLIEKRCKH